MTGDVAQWLKRRNSTPEDPGFDPLAGQGDGQFFLSFRVNPCADVFVPELPSCVRHEPKFVRMLQIPYPSVVKEFSSQPVVWKHETFRHTGRKPR